MKYEGPPFCAALRTFHGHHGINMTVTEQLSTLDNILAHGDITSLFQPIVSLSQRRVLGYEALTRGPYYTALLPGMQVGSMSWR